MSAGIPYENARIDVGFSCGLRAALNSGGLVLDGSNTFTKRLFLAYEQSFATDLLTYRQLSFQVYPGLPPGNLLDLLNLPSLNGQSSIGIHPKGVILVADWLASAPFSRFHIHGQGTNGYNGWGLHNSRYYVTSAWPVFCLVWQGSYPVSGNRIIYFVQDEGVPPERLLVVIWGD